MTGVWDERDLERDVSVGVWVRDALAAARPGTVGSLVPAGFEAYARVLRPVATVDASGAETRLRWSDVARATGATVHPMMQLNAIMGPGVLRGADAPSPAEPVPTWEEQLAVLAEILGGGTGTPDECVFGFWEGNTAFDELPADVPKLDISGFGHYLLRGPGMRAREGFEGIAPHIWWPVDRSWVAAAHFDFPCVYLGGDEECVRGVFDSPVLESWRAEVEQKVTSDSDDVNTVRSEDGPSRC